MKKLSPYQARGTDEVCTLRTDHHDTENAWLLTNGYRVTICKQKAGKSATGSVSLDRTEFNKLVRWYVREQATVQRS